ncbi:condensation domain-containing protein [Streptacidiphilus sp. P02-A3a]|uniref:condensation domain-containing protein n=1 Tax=Streptacidiphilus sp. P02-A3a TaxID=2704468 RepID=UPI0015F93CEE|nr:condensation domain-containing protein [Streptacidiphilus sp. P02-A3a]QMU71301.1 hypothetical protein GXP74_26810 [Streptacidiphilus sp. P02-A3a]
MSPETGLAARLAALSPEQLARLRARTSELNDRQLTPGQQRLWEVQRAAPGRPVDVVCQAVRLTGAGVDLDRLAARLREFVQAQEALRTTFETTGDVVRPVAHPRLPPLLRRERCSGEAQAHSRARELAEEPFDLAGGPLLRVVLAEGASPEECWLLVAVHNLVFDAWSFELLLDWLAAPAADDAPAADSAPAADRAPARPFGAFAREQRAWCAGPAGRAAAAYWGAELAAAPAPLPTDRPRRAATGRPGRRLEFSQSAATARGIAEAARSEAATPYAGWLAVLWATLAEFGGTEDTVLGTFTANRDTPEAGEVVGYLLNVLPLRLRDPGDGTHRSRVRAVRAATRAGQRHLGYPGELIARDAGRGLPGAHPLFDAVLVFDNLGQQERRIQGARVATADVDKGTARYDLTFAVHPGADGADCWLEYDTDRYDESTARRLVRRFSAFAERAATPGGSEGDR